MSFKIFHQLGYRYQWNFQSANDDGTADGFIISPRHMARDIVIGLSSQIKRNSLFDPQFFLPSSPLGGLSSYDFFPDVMCDGFNTEEFSGVITQTCASRCVGFQLENEFLYVVIPTRRMSGMPTNFTEVQQEMFIEPFLQVIEEVKPKAKVVIQLIINDNMINDEEYSKEILNWVTGFQQIDGVYLITEVSSRQKQIMEIDFLYNLLNFIDNLRNNELEVILGYLNTEAVLLSLASPSIVTIGSYENTRRFNIRSFEDSESNQQGPTPRIYVSKLLQHVDYRYIGAINRALGNATGFFDENQYQAQMFQPTYRWHFTKPELYKHYFLVFSQQLRWLARYTGKERYEALRDMIETAQTWYSKLDEVVFDVDSGGQHLSAWLTVANQFAKKQGWRK